MPYRILSPIALSLVVLMLTACVDLEPRQSNIRYYVLSDAVSQASDTSGTAGEAVGPAPPEEAAQGGLVVGIRKVRVAAYLNTPSITTRYGEHEVRFGEFHRWGEDLGEAVARTVAQSLSLRPGLQRVDVVPWPDRTQHDLLVQLRVLRFEGEAPPLPPGDDEPDEPVEGSARMVAVWEIFDPETQDVLVERTTDHREEGWTVGDYAGLVDRLDAALKVLADDLAAQMDAMR